MIYIDPFKGMKNRRLPPPPRLSLRHLEQLMDQLLDGVILMDPTGTILRVNAAALRMHEADRQQDLGGTADAYAERFVLRHEDGHPMRRRDYPLVRLVAGEGFEDLVVQVAPAGEDEARWVHRVRDVVMNEDGGEPDYLALVITDVSAQFDAEARFNAMFRANPAPALVIRLRDQRIAQANPGFLELTGFDAGKLVGRTPFGLDLFEGIVDASAVRRAIESGEVVPQTEAELLVADGTRRLVLFAGQPIDVTDEDALLLTFADLEPRRQAHAALAASERQLADLLELAPVAIVVTQGPDGVISHTNLAFRTLTDHDNAVGRTIDDIALWSDAQARREAEAQLATGETIRGLDVRLVGAGGGAFDCLASAETVKMGGKSVSVWLFQDITERRRGEAELVEAIDTVLRDAGWLSRSIMDRLAAIRRPGTSTPAADLSPREREVLELICLDLGDAAIAERLGLSRNTVRNHVARLYDKIGVRRRSAAVIWGRDRGMGGP